LRANPFMRCEEPGVIAAASRHAGHPLADPVSVLGALREWKNNF
jgi:hydroxyacylglutathione hydrolase